MNTFLPSLATRAGRRTTVVLLWTAFALYVLLNTALRGSDAAEALGAGVMLAAYAAFFALNRAVRIGARPGDLPLDEREQALRDHAHYRSYQLLGWGMLAVIVYAYVAVRVEWLWLPASPRQAVSAFMAVVIALGLLPLSVLAWIAPEPMMDDDVETAPRPSLPRGRMTVVMVAAAAVLTAALAAAAGVGPVPAGEASTLAGVGVGMATVAGVLLLLDRRRA
ncbi:MAG TPA: hypothetical protein VF613_04505 [Longimicrobium sp.]|jgi:hypothetical protein